MDSMLSQVTQLQQTRSELRNTLLSINERESKIDQEIAKLSTENASLETEIERVSNEIRQTADKLANVNTEFENESKCRSSLSLTMSSMEEKIRDLEKCLAAQNADMDQLTEFAAHRLEFMIRASNGGKLTTASVFLVNSYYNLFSDLTQTISKLYNMNNMSSSDPRMAVEL